MLQITNLTFNAWGRQFLDDASVSLPPGSKVGLVGRNGIGKSTLFKIILGELAGNGDEVSLPKSARIGSVDQEHPATPVSVVETILEADTERHELLGRLETAEPEEMGEIWNRLIEIDADGAPARAAEILAGLGFDHENQQRPMAEFSGGWRMRVALAAALFAQPDMLLLDEPTNYLDLEGALWLEALIAASLIVLFVVGVVIGGTVARRFGEGRRSVVLATEAMLLLAGATLCTLGHRPAGMVAVVLAMGVENAVFQKQGDVGVGLTYMTGTLVRMGQRITTALHGGPRWDWLPFLALWAGLSAGGALGAAGYLRFDVLALWPALVVVTLLALATWRSEARTARV